MNKSELISSIAAKAEVTKADAEKTLAAVIETIQESLVKGEDVALIGFGTFTVKTRAARTGRNPQTGKTIEIAEAKVPSFKPGTALKNAVAK